MNFFIKRCAKDNPSDRTYWKGKRDFLREPKLLGRLVLFFIFYPWRRSILDPLGECEKGVVISNRETTTLFSMGT